MPRVDVEPFCCDVTLWTDQFADQPVFNTDNAREHKRRHRLYLFMTIT